MAGGFDPIDPERCAHYAGFASHLDRRSFDFIYWFLFLLVIGMLFLSSWQYSGDLEKIRVQGWEPGSSRYKRKMIRCMIICSIYGAVSVVSIIMEVYALMALQFCDGEDLMPLYWSTWTMMQVGSVIAIFGIMLNNFNSLRGGKNPPWALALGTPVLVVAGIGHAVHDAVRIRVNRVRSRSRGGRRARGVSRSGSVSTETTGFPMSREQTLRADDSEKEDAELTAKFLGFTADGAPIMKFLDDPGKIEPDQGVVIGRSEGHVIIAFRKAMAVVGGGHHGPSTSSGGSSNSGSSTAAEGPGPSSPARISRPMSRSPVVRIASPPRGRARCEDSPV